MAQCSRAVAHSWLTSAYRNRADASDILVESKVYYRSFGCDIEEELNTSDERNKACDFF